MPRRLVVAAGLAWVPVLRLLAWALLFASVWITVLGLPMTVETRIQMGILPRWLYLVPAVLFGGFVLAFAAYRFVLVRKGRYNPARGFLQVGLAVLVLTWVGTASVQRYQAAPVEVATPVDLLPLLEASDPAVRAVACEALVARGKTDSEAAARKRAALLASEDPDPRVRSACARLP